MVGVRANQRLNTVAIDVVSTDAQDGLAYDDHMSQTLTVRLSKELADWLKDASRTLGVPMARIVRGHLERARTQELDRPYLRLVGKLSGPPDLSSRNGFSRK